MDSTNDDLPDLDPLPTEWNEKFIALAPRAANRSAVEVARMAIEMLLRRRGRPPAAAIADSGPAARPVARADEA